MVGHVTRFDALLRNAYIVAVSHKELLDVYEKLIPRERINDAHIQARRKLNEHIKQLEDAGYS